MEEKFNLYDKIIAATYTNIANYAFDKSKIYINFNPSLYSRQVFLKVALLVANFENKKVYLKCKFFDFLKILFYYYSIKEIFEKNRCRLRFTVRERNERLDVGAIAAFETNAFGVSTSIWKEIWKEYYQK